jgi:putative glycosyltransferase
MLHWAGFVQIGIPVVKGVRAHPSTYTLAKRMSLLARAITSFSARPLYASLWVGFAALIISFVNAGYVIVEKLLHPMNTLVGFPSIIAVITAMFGVMMLSIGIVGVYVARIFVQTQGRPLFIIKSIE